MSDMRKIKCTSYACVDGRVEGMGAGFDCGVCDGTGYVDAASPAPQSGEPVALETTAAERADWMRQAEENDDASYIFGDDTGSVARLLRDFDKLLAAPPPSDVGEIVAFIRRVAGRYKLDNPPAKMVLLETLADRIEAGDYRPAKEKPDEA